MSVPIVTAKAKFPFDPRLPKRDHAKNLRDANRATAVYHHQVHIPRHFEHFAAAKYGYAPRRSRVKRDLTYQQLKNQLGLPPLVSPRATGGTTRHAVTTQRRVTATQHRARLFVRLPFRGGTGRFRLLPGQRKLTVHQEEALKRVQEIEAIAPDEQRTLGRTLEHIYARKAAETLKAKTTALSGLWADLGIDK